jgi:hypothetical protein
VALECVESKNLAECFVDSVPPLGIAPRIARAFCAALAEAYRLDRAHDRLQLPETNGTTKMVRIGIVGIGFMGMIQCRTYSVSVFSRIFPCFIDRRTNT